MAGERPHHGPPRRPGAPPRRFSRLERNRTEQADSEGSSGLRAHAHVQSELAGWERSERADRALGEARSGRPGLGLRMLRYGLPGVVVLAGVIAMSFATTNALEGGAGLVSAGLAIWFLNWLFRVGARGDVERDAEDRARDYFDHHGRWPEGR